MSESETYDIRIPGTADGGDRYKIEWWEGSRHRTRKVALFRLATDDRVAGLQHIRSVCVSQRMEFREARLDHDAGLKDIPREWRLLMQADGFEPAEELPQNREEVSNA